MAHVFAFCLLSNRENAIASRLCDTLSDLDSGVVAGQLHVLVHEGLAKRRKVGRHVAYSLSNAGVGVVHSCHVMLIQLGFETNTRPDRGRKTEAAQARQIPKRQPPAAASPALVDAATVLNHAANSLRLRILLALTEGGRASHQLVSELGGMGLNPVSQHLGILRSGSLVSADSKGGKIIYNLTANGLSLVQVIRATCSGLSIRRGQLVLRPEPIRAGQADALDPTSPDGLACLLKTFAHPFRLRILNLLVRAGEVCECHLPEALRLPKSLIGECLAPARKVGLVLDRGEGRWVFLSPAPSASNLCRSLFGCFNLRLADLGVFDADWQRLQNLAGCAKAESDPRRDSGKLDTSEPLRRTPQAEVPLGLIHLLAEIGTKIPAWQDCAVGQPRSCPDASRVCYRTLAKT